MKKTVLEFTKKDAYEFGDITKALIARLTKEPSKPYQAEVRSVFGWTDVEPGSPTQDDDGFESEEPIPIEDHQAKLPRLPIPKLEATCKLYLKTVRPLCTEEEYARVQEVVSAFLQPGGEGERLQQGLIEWDKADGENAKPSWLERWWDDGYLRLRSPIAINVNYFFGFEEHTDPTKNHQICRAASLLRGALRLCSRIRKGCFHMDSERGKPLCMSQYKRVFCCSRIPGTRRDSLITYTTQPPPQDSRSSCSLTSVYEAVDPNHVVVICQNRFFWFDVFRDGNVVFLSEIEHALSKILQLCTSEKKPAPPVGVFTASVRNVWAGVRHQLLEISPSNAEALRKIQQAVIVICLDSLQPVNQDEFSRILLHGPGTNRWFDKHNLIVCANGKAGINFEHAMGDGATTLRIADEMFQFSTRRSHTAEYVKQISQNLPAKYQELQVTELHWQLSEQLTFAMKDQFAIFKQEILATETSTLHFARFGGAWIKDTNMSPDAFVQVAIQLAHWKLFGYMAPIYEAASTRAFLHGRTECVRGCTIEAKNFCEATTQPLLREDGSSTQYDLLKRAVQAHVDYMKKCKEGHGVDRHLLGLRMIHEQTILGSAHGPSMALSTESPVTLTKAKSFSGTVRPAIFEDPLYARSSHWKLSTSHCGCPSLSLFGFGPVVIDGFGIGYMIKNEVISFNVTSKHTHALSSAAAFTSLLEQSLLHLRAVVFSNPTARAAPSKSMTYAHPTSSAEFSYLHYDQDLWDNVLGY
eukprot:TRINITY_DN9996_c0_g1_i1.p1 TRINITY_DN9996_c0_g1~~TRINITY_DN9996_c0_g1_i1.p1  ORF type:complete len:752 (-),score=103.44 TRINITY_DN9996_c0_g1_i1:100-2355(-)